MLQLQFLNSPSRMDSDDVSGIVRGLRPQEASVCFCDTPQKPTDLTLSLVFARVLAGSSHAGMLHQNLTSSMNEPVINTPRHVPARWGCAGRNALA